MLSISCMCMNIFRRQKCLRMFNVLFTCKIVITICSTNNILVVWYFFSKRRPSKFDLGTVCLYSNKYGDYLVTETFVSSTTYFDIFQVEFSWLPDIFVIIFLCCRKNDCCCRCWRLILWIDNWRKALVYVVFGVPMFIRDLVTVFTVICGKFYGLLTLLDFT